MRLTLAVRTSWAAVVALGLGALPALAQQYDRPTSLPAVEAQAGPRYAAQPARPIAPVNQSADSGFDPEGLARRLAEAEAQIARMQEEMATARVAPASLTSAAPAAEAPAAPADDSELKKKFASWLDETKKNTYPSLTVNGVFQADAGFFTQDAESVAAHGQLQDGADFRRARLSAKGSVTETVNYMFQMDFAAFGRPTFTDVWVEQTDIPLLGNLRFGQWKQPFSLEVVSSFRYTTFMERSLLFQPFTPFRHIGAGFYNHADNLNWTWAASGFRTGQDQYGGSISDNGGWGSAERITHLLYYDEPSDGRYYLHTGAGHFFSNPPNDTVNFRTIPEIYIGDQANGAVGTSGQALPGVFNGTPYFVATGPLNVSSYNVVGGELLWVKGPFSLQSEGMVAMVDQNGNPNGTLPGAYAQAGYFLTGEHRPYDRVAGCIDRVKPFEDFFLVDTPDGHCAGWGAWELAVRGSYIDLTDENINGGQLTDVTAGVNWYWNAYTKMVFNYIHAYNNNPLVGQNNTDIYAARIQVDF